MAAQRGPGALPLAAPKEESWCVFDAWFFAYSVQERCESLLQGLPAASVQLDATHLENLRFNK